MRVMVSSAARNLMADQLHELPLSNFFTKPRFELDRESLSKPSIVLESKGDEGMKDVEERSKLGSNTSTKDWLQLGVASGNHEVRKTDPTELELFTDCRLSCQAGKQINCSFKRQRQALLGPHGRSSGGPVVGGDFTVVSPPRRPEAGVWLVLSAAQNQLKEPLILPQIERSYLRIKDCNMTVRLLMKYLASKLGLRNETEVEICCKGQSLPPFLMLQYVRDHIWGTKDDELTTTHVAIADHVMTLNYRRRRTSCE